jgi:M6 family metalloprotease-like protein
MGLGFPRPATRLKASGDVRLTVLFVDFPDAAARGTPESVFDLVSPTSENYFRAVSYGRMTLVYDPVYRWVRMRRPSTTYGIDILTLTYEAHRAYIQEAVDEAGASVDYSRADGLLVLANPDAVAVTIGPGFLGDQGGGGVMAGGRLIQNAATSGRDLLRWGAFWANHEFGHTLGLLDLYHQRAPANRSVGMYSLMGLISGPAREFFAFERWGLGWLDDAQVVCAGSGEIRATLTPVERSGGTKLIVAPVSATSAVITESRRIEGYDAGFAPGVLVYYVDTAVPTQQGPIRVLPIDDADPSKGTVTLTAGRSLTYQGVTVTVLGSDGSGDVVQVVR